MHRLLALLTLALLLLPLAGHSAPVSGLYETVVTARGTDAEARQAAVQEAFRKVAVKLTGRSDAARSPAVQSLLATAEAYVQQYRYSEQPAADGSQQLWVSFDPRGVESALRQSGLELWGQQRPLTLVWAVVDSGQGRELVSADGPAGAAAALQAAATDRGLPLVLPLLDLEDRQALTASDVWGRFAEPIQAASRRYTSDAVLAGRVFRTPRGEWQSDWSLLQGMQTQRWSATSPTREAALAAGVAGATDSLARQYTAPALLTAAPGLLTLVVRDVRRYEDYGQALRYLESLPQVVSVQVLQATPGELRFALDLRGSQDALARALALEHRLEPVAAAPASPPQAGLVYRWRR